jgi:hypothetical protein
VTAEFFRAQRVTSAEAEIAYSLVAMSHPHVGPAAWARYLRAYGRHASRERGLIALKDSRGCMHGLFAFTVVHSLAGEATLHVTELAAARLPGTMLIDSLVSFANKLALELELPAIQLDLQPSAVWEQDREVMAESGFTLDRVTMRGRATG